MFKIFSKKYKPMKKLQNKINRGESVSIIIGEIEQMNTHKNPLESINTLFSITESLLKEILENNKPCGKNICLYQTKNSDTIVNLQQIKKAISIRHETAHALLIRDVIKTDFAIETYIKYIRIIAYENKIDLDTFIPLSIEELDIFSPKKSIVKKLTILTVMSLLAFFLSFNKTIHPKFLTGSPTGTYYLIAKDIKESIAPNLVVLKSQGSIKNMNIIGLSQKNNEPIFTFVQNDVLQYLSKEARAGDGDNQKILNKTKVLMPIYNEEIHILVREDNLDIKNFRDLKDKKISIGMRDSGTAITAKLLYFRLFHEEMDKVYLTFNKALKALQDRKIDAVILTGGQPLFKLNKNISKIRLISYKGEPLEGYEIGYIKKSSYLWLKEKKIRTLSVKSFLVTNIDYNKENSNYLKKFLEKLEDYKENLRENNNLKNIHPKLKDLAQQRCLPTLPIGLEYHQLIKWDTPWCKK